MSKVIGVRFRQAGKVYFFAPGDFQIRRGDHVIVETARGVEYGMVVFAPREMPEETIVQPLKDIIRVATPEDDKREADNRKNEREAYRIAQDKIRKHNLDMKLVKVEYTFDNNKILFYFTADGRVDFRELVKDLASIFKTRIELRQIGVRDEAKLLGGIGVCGRPLCCSTYMADFVPVSIKMAKEQNLSLNPMKISGICGRLMCCLKNEEDTYEYLNSKLPKLGSYVTTPDGLSGKVSSVNVLRQKVKVIIELEDEDEKEEREYTVDEISAAKGGRRFEERSEHAQDEKKPEGRERNQKGKSGDRKEHGNRSENGERGNRGDRAGKQGEGNAEKKRKHHDNENGQRSAQNHDGKRRESRRERQQKAIEQTKERALAELEDKDRREGNGSLDEG